MVERPFFAALPCFDDVSFDCWSLVDIALFVESTAVVVIFVVVSDGPAASEDCLHGFCCCYAFCSRHFR